MAVIDARPQGVELRAYAGDTFMFKIITDVDYSGHTWKGEIRSDHSDQDVDANFEFSTPQFVIDKWETTVTLSATNTQLLADLPTNIVNQPPRVVVVGGTSTTVTSVNTYKGVWDVQVKSGLIVKTLVQGTIEVDSDVTRSV